MPKLTKETLRVKDWITAEVTRNTANRLINLGWGLAIAWGLSATLAATAQLIAAIKH